MSDTKIPVQDRLAKAISDCLENSGCAGLDGEVVMVLGGQIFKNRPQRRVKGQKGIKGQED